MYFSLFQIQQALERLSEVNPFFGTAYLAFKRIDLPVGTTQTVNFTSTMEDILIRYYRPLPSSDHFFSPYKTSNQVKRWNATRYASTTLQRIVTNTFSDVFLHDKRTQLWGWVPNYVDVLHTSHLESSLLPAYEMGVWLFRSWDWPENTTPDDVIRTLFAEFHIADEEALALFDQGDSSLFQPWDIWQAEPVNERAVLQITGTPPDYKADEGATLQSLSLTEVGPVRRVEIELAPRLNLITGDNGLGKTFLLDCAWWALTGTWPNDMAEPRSLATRPVPTIGFRLGTAGSEAANQEAHYDATQNNWIVPGDGKRRVLPGLSVYAYADGSFMIWDPARQSLVENRVTLRTTQGPYIRFRRDEVWHGLEPQDSFGHKLVVSNGLLRDWISWQQTPDDYRFQQFVSALLALSPHPDEALVPGPPARRLLDARPIPTLNFPYGNVQITHASAGIQRIVALAYMLVWAWDAHVTASQAIGREPQRSVVLLVDEMESHLHPFWQRTIVPAILRVIESLANETNTQLLIATHSPLVLASVEYLFDDERDSLYHMKLQKGTVTLDNLRFVKRGRADLWLMSEAFGLKQPRSLIAEQLIDEALQLQSQDDPSVKEIERVARNLVRALAPDDEFWPQWKYFAHVNGVEM